MKRFGSFAILVMLVLLLAGCLPGPNRLERVPDEQGEVAGFFSGIWHGLMAPITFIISLFSRSIRFYEVHNSGGWYNFGFVLGAGLFLSGGILGSKRKKR